MHDEPVIDAYRELVRRLLEGPLPSGETFDACRAVLGAHPASEEAFPALCMLLEGALGDARLGIDDTQLVVPLLKNLARGTVQPEELL